MKLGFGLMLGNASAAAASPPASLTVTGTASVSTGNVQTLSADGTGPWTWSITTNNSGGSIVAGSGAYTAGDTGGVADTIHVVDSGGRAGNFSVTVNHALPADVTWTFKIDPRTFALADNADIVSFANGGTAGGTINPGSPAQKFRTSGINGQPVIRATGTSAASTTTTRLLDIGSATTYYFFAVAINNSTSTHNGGAPWSDPALLFGGTTYWSMGMMNQDAGNVWGAYNWDANADQNMQPGTHGVATLVMQRHLSGSLDIRVGSADTWHTTPSGNTAVTTGNMLIMPNTAADLGYMLVTGDAMTASQIARTIDYIKSVWGSGL